MRLRPLTVAVWFAIALAALRAPGARAESQGGAAQPAAGPTTTATRQNAFTIPFRIEPAQSAAAEPVEVQLQVSANSGRTWEVASRVKPEKGSFVFRAPHDGEYWFAIRTVDRQGIARPDKLEPQLKVVVDTVAPRLDLSAARGSAGELLARWQAVDPHLKAGSFKLEYQTAPSGPWERVSVDAAPRAMRYTLSGQTTWWPPANVSSIKIRAEITDAAGNPAVSQAVVNLAAAPGTESVGQPPGNEAPSSNPTATRWPTDRSTSDPLSRAAGDARGTAGATGDAAWRTGKSAAPPQQRVAAQPVSRSTDGAAPAVDANGLPAGERPRMVNTRNFELEYEIDSVGRSGIGKVELYATTDGGRTWSPFGLDPDQQSPIAVRVDGAGLYGFRIVVQSGSGLGGDPPAPGDQPQIWVGVDLTQPVGRIIGADLTEDGSELVIRWEASDDLLDPRPITLAYSAGAVGPWTPIAAGLENSGTYRWRLDDAVPERIFLRMEIRDEAGNAGVFETTDPVTVERSRPEAKIRGVRPK